jgi:HTH-type transcriptional regulator / antitoxin HigA
MNTARVDRTYIELVREFPLVPLRSKAVFEEAVEMMKRLARRLDSLTRGERDYLAVLGDLIAQYERRLRQLDREMTPREVLAHLMEINDLAQCDLVECVGHKSNLSAFLNGHRGLSKRAAARLADYFKVSPVLFLPKQ